MPPAALAVVFLVVMGTALACFVVAFRLRRETRRHVRWAIAGTAVDVLGTTAAVLCRRVLDWRVPAHDETVARLHLGVAYVASALVIAQATSGALRLRVHPRLAPALLVAYGLAYALALVAYAPRP